MYSRNKVNPKPVYLKPGTHTRGALRINVVALPHPAFEVVDGCTDDLCRSAHEVNGLLSSIIAHMDIGADLDEHFHDLEPSAPCGDVECCLASVASGVDLCAALDEHLAYEGPVSAGGGVEGAGQTDGARVRVGAKREEAVYGGGFAGEGGVVEEGAAVGRAGHGDERRGRGEEGEEGRPVGALD